MTFAAAVEVATIAVLGALVLMDTAPAARPAGDPAGPSHGRAI